MIIIESNRPEVVVEALHTEHGRCNRYGLGKVEHDQHDSLCSPQFRRCRYLEASASLSCREEI